MPKAITDHPSLKAVATASDLVSLEEIRLSYLGRKGSLTKALKNLKNLSVAQKKKKGPELTGLKKKLEAALEKKKLSLTKALFAKRVTDLDLTRPSSDIQQGTYHPLSLIEKDIKRIFSSMNFSVIDGPEIETDFYNFDALNIPENHPARDMWDTFWLSPLSPKADRLLLRTHTSNVQVRHMEKVVPPIRAISLGRVFRYEATDATHEANFGQFEGLVVGEDITLANLKGVLEPFFEKFFDEKVSFRYRSSYFPFVEPGIEVDVRLGKGKWLELLGAGMVHQNVLVAAGYPRGKYQGFAFGCGVDRLAMIKYGVPDVRLFYGGDTRSNAQLN